MIKALRISSLLSGLFLMSLSSFGQSALSGVSSDKNNSLQDPQQAIEYFEKELAFTTNPYGAKMAIEGKQNNVVIVDVRSAEAYAKGHIPGAINIPHEKFNNFDGSQTEFPGLKKDHWHYVYCYELLCNLAQKAAKTFAAAGYPVKELKGGFEAWKHHEYPIEK